MDKLWTCVCQQINSCYYIQSKTLPIIHIAFPHCEINSLGIQEFWKMVQNLSEHWKEIYFLSHFGQILWFTPVLVKAERGLQIKGFLNITFIQLFVWNDFAVLKCCYFLFWKLKKNDNILFPQFLQGCKDVKTLSA